MWQPTRHGPALIMPFVFITRLVSCRHLAWPRHTRPDADAPPRHAPVEDPFIAALLLTRRVGLHSRRDRADA